MLERAAAKHLHAELRQADIAAARRGGLPPQALIVAADVFIYLGALEEVLRLCRRTLAPEGVLLFSLEHAALGEGAWRLGPSGHYAHAPDYVARRLAEAGLVVVERRDEALRLESDHTVEGMLILVRPASH